MVTVLDVAQQAGVSSATVSRVLNGRDPVARETRARVLAAVERLGYRPNYLAQSLRLGRGRAVALLTGDIEQGAHAALTKHVQGALETIGLDLLLFNLSHREDRLLHLLERATSLGLRGILIAAPHVIAVEKLLPIIAELSAGDIPVLSIGQRLDRHGIPSVVHDDAGGAAAAVAHLAARGRTPIAFLGRIRDSAVGRARFRGYRRALRRLGLASPRALVWESRDRYRSDAGYEATAAALARAAPPRAVVAASDELALGAIAAALDHGLDVPDDLAVVGFGGLDWGAHLRPALTTVATDLQTVGGHLAAMFAALEHGRPIVPLTIIRPTLLIRQSA